MSVTSSAAGRQPQTGSVGERIFLIHANDHTGHRAYYFVQVNPLRVPQFQKALKGSDAMDLESYGEIIASGYGNASEEVRSYIRKRFGWNG